MAEEGVKIVISAEDQASDVVQKISGSFTDLEAKVISAAAVIVSIREGIALAKDVFEATAGKVLDFAEGIEKINIAAEGLGITAQAFHNLQDASYLLTGSSDTLNQSLLLMGRNLGMAATGAGPAAQALTQLGLSAQVLQGLSLDEQFTVLAQALGTVSDQSTKLNLAQELFGRGFREIIPLLAEGGRAFTDAKNTAAGLSYTLDTGLVMQAQNLVTHTRQLSLAWDSFKASLASFLPVVTGVIDAMHSLVDSVKWLKENNFGFYQSGGSQSEMAARAGSDQVASSNGFGIAPSFAALRAAADEQAISLQNAKAATDAEWIETENAKAAWQDMSDAQQKLTESMKTGREIFSLLPKAAKEFLTAFGFDADQVGLSFTGGVNKQGGQFAGITSNLNDMLGTSLTSGMLEGGIGAAFALLMSNPVMQAEMKKLNELLQNLITPLAEAIAPALDSIAPIMEELKPVFVILGQLLKDNLAPLVMEMHALNQVIKPLSDAIEKLKNAIEKMTGGGGPSQSGMDSMGNALMGYALGGWVGAGAAVFGGGGGKLFDSGGLITPADMLGYNPSTGHGLIRAQAGESVNPRGGGGGHTFNISAPDPRGAAEATRQMLEEISLRHGLAVA